MNARLKVDRHGIATLTTVLLLAVGLLAAAAPATALITSGGCVDEVSGTNNVCTANDVTFVAIGLGQQEDGCVNPGDTVDILLGGTVANTTAQTRYDVGLYVSVDGDPNGDGAQTGTCAREILNPAGVQGVATCNPSSPNALDLLRLRDDFAVPTGIDNGPYLNVDGDTCADLNASSTSSQATGCDEDGNGLWDDTLIRFSQPLAFPCDDVDANGFIEIPTCATWGNQNNQVGGVSCDSELEAVPGTKSKCNCQIIDSTVPAPNLSFNCTSPSQTLHTNETGTFSVAFTNNVSCTPDLALPEREQCGTASYVFYQVDYDETRGTVSNIQITRNDGSPYTGTFTHDTTNGLITWTPVSSRQGSAGILGSGDAATLSYDYTYTSTDQNATISNSTSTYWTNSASELGNPAAAGVTAQTSLSCTSSASATPVTLASVEVGPRVLSWTTATEAANLGFNVHARGPEGWHQVNDEVIASEVIDSTAPRRYAFDLSGVGARRFMLEDVALDGTKTLHGPFSRGSSYGTAPTPRAIDWQSVRAEAARSEGPGRATLAARKGPGAATPSARLLVDTDGVQRVGYEDLAAAGVDLSGVPAPGLALFRGDEAVPIRVEPSGGTFGPGSFVEFVGEAVDTLYTRTNVYELTRDPRNALRIPEDRSKVRGGAATPSYRAVRTVERDRTYSFASPGDDPWYDTRMLAFTAPRSWSFEVNLDAYAGGGPVEVAVELWGATSWPEEGDHHAVAYWNGVEIADGIWDGQTAHRLAATVPAGRTADGLNTLTVELPGDRGVSWDVIDLESITVAYPRRFDARGDSFRFTASGDRYEVVNAPAGEPAVYRVEAGGPVRLTDVTTGTDTGARTWTFAGAGAGEATFHLASDATVARPGVEAGRAVSPADLLAGGSADYLVVSHGAFVDGLGPLVAAREADGLSVRVVDVADVYEAYTDGVIDPEAIRAYIADAARELGTHYVLLVGGDTYDYHDHLGQGAVSFIPSLYAPTGAIVRYAPVDPLFTDLDGDRVPDLPIGRLPVRTRAELDAVIGKILDYERKGYGETALLVADGRDGSTGFSFSQAGDAFATALPAGWSVERAYVDSIGASGARERLLRTLDDGVALTSFIGHSGLTQWTFSHLFAADDVRSLANAGAPTVVLQWGCWNTYHVEPRFHSLAHRFLLTPDKGAAAVLGSATLLETTSANALSEHLAPLVARPGVTLGDAMTAAKQELAASQPDRVDAILGWTLLGDPALTVSP